MFYFTIRKVGSIKRKGVRIQSLLESNFSVVKSKGRLFTPMLMKAQSLTFITFALAVVLFLSVGAQGKKPNVVIVITDDQGYGDPDAPEIR